MATRATERPFAEARETHAGVVILMGERAYKFKKPVDLGFLDYTSIDARWSVCRREVELNCRLAPDVYLGVGELDVPSASPEPVVVMRRMPEEARLSGLVARGEATPMLMRDLAKTVAAFHSRALRGPTIAAEGTRDAISQRWEASFEQCHPFRSTILVEEVVTEIERLVRVFLAGRQALFDDRVAHGRVVDGHGDLIADDVFCLQDGPRMLDCLEFNDRLRYVDQLDDIAFLGMDLERLGASDLATALLTAFVDYANDPAPPALLHHFLAYRAFVRVKVACLRSAQVGADPTSDRAARQLSELAVRHLRDAAVRLVLVGGPPGSGKTTLAGAVADRLGMVVLSSDRIRKELAGIDPRHSASAPYGEGIYAPSWTARTYTELLHRAERLLERGESVLLDATWSDPERRSEAESVADRTASELTVLRCGLDERTAAERIRARSGISDADVVVAHAVRNAERPWLGGVDIDTALPPAKCAEDAVAAIRPFAPRRVTRFRSLMAPD